MTADLDMTNRDNLIIHIEGLQTTLTKRNARIAELEALLAGVDAEARKDRAVTAAYRRGWKECAGKLMDEISNARGALDRVRSVAYIEYLEGER